MTPIENLVLTGYLKAGDRLIWNRKSLRTVHIATVVLAGSIKTEDGRIHKSPSGAAKHLGKKPIDGWLAWKVEGSGESLDSLRKKLLTIR